jgi:hypothetical protein
MRALGLRRAAVAAPSSVLLSTATWPDDASAWTLGQDDRHDRAGEETTNDGSDIDAVVKLR